MIHQTLNLIKQEFRPGAAFNNVARVASYHRIQCSPGIRDAARYISSALGAEGLQVEMLEYPARKGVSWWAQDSFPEWIGKDAELVVLEDGKEERLCSFAESKFSLIQRSAATPPEGIRTTMVLVENGSDPAAYEGLDVKGKFVFTRGSVPEIAAVAVDRYGAAGIVVDTMREQPPVRDRFDLPDARQYLSFWPNDFSKHNARGFVVTPRQGAALRARYAAGKKELAVYARIDTEYRDGTLEVMSAVIPGETDEEVVGVAHVCHPEPSANDNASGCGALMEAASALGRLVRSGRLPRPRRTIRFLWLPEMSGSYAYLANNEDKLAKTVAAINLDMVGENQDLCGSTFNVEKPIKALPGFGGDLAEAILHLLTKEATNLGGTGAYAMFRWAVSPFSGGSDHNIWGDPNVGVTCPMLIQWPDKFYHTSADTIDKVDPHMLMVAGTLAATYLYVAATATPADAAFIAGEMATRFAGEVDAQVSTVIRDAARMIESGQSQEDVLARTRRIIERRVRFLQDRKLLDIDSLVKLADDAPEFAEAREEAKCSVLNTAKFLLTKALRDLASVGGLPGVHGLPPAWEPEATQADALAVAIVPKRLFRGPFRTSGKDSPPAFEEKMKAFGEKHGHDNPAARCLEYWVDGQRSLAEIADLMEGETGFRNMAMLVDYFELMRERGVFAV
ncbi:MAG: DUF4910 domain-containing protein [Bacillota bacterium]